MNITSFITLRHKFFWFFLILNAGILIPRETYAKAFSSKSPQAFGVTAKAAYAVDYTNRKVLFARNIHAKFFPASTVKLMTALVVLENKNLDDRVEITQDAVNAQPTKAGLTKGATYSVGQLLEVLLATSANDAGVALAESVAGSEEAFAALMNKKAKALGMRDTRFTNATGLPHRHQVSSVYDLSILTRTALSEPFVKSVLEKKIITIAGSDGKKIVRNNHNKLLWRITEPCVLGKTGYTIAAGHCYAGIAYYDERRVSVVIMKSRKPWSDICAILKIKTKKKT